MLCLVSNSHSAGLMSSAIRHVDTRFRRNLVQLMRKVLAVPINGRQRLFPSGTLFIRTLKDEVVVGSYDGEPPKCFSEWLACSEQLSIARVDSQCNSNARAVWAFLVGPEVFRRAQVIIFTKFVR
jgi:hypothetical protein